MSTYNVFDTEAEAIEAEAGYWKDGAKPAHKEYIRGQLQKINVTKCWAKPKQRLDGKWVFQKPISLASIEEFINGLSAAIFDTEAEAIEAEIVYWNEGIKLAHKDYIKGQPQQRSIIQCWVVPKQREDGKWIFEKPPADKLGGHGPYTEEEYDASWFKEVS